MDEIKSGKYQVIDKDGKVLANLMCSEKTALRVMKTIEGCRILREDGTEVRA